MLSGASGTVAGRINKRTFVNEGSLSLVETGLYLAEAAVLRNKATMTVNWNSTYALSGESSTSLINTGHFRHTEGSGTTGIEVPFVNEGIVEVTAGTLAFEAGGSGNAAASFVSSPGALIRLLTAAYTMSGTTWHGAIQIAASASVTTEGLLAENATVEMGLGQTWTISKGTTTVAGFKMGGGVLAGAGNLSVTGTFAWAGGEMKGSGTTTVQQSGSGSIAGNLVERSFVNNGELKVAEAELFMGKKAYFENAGTLIDNYEVVWSIGLGSEENTRGILNTGTFERTGPGEAKSGEPGVEPRFENKGLILEGSGIRFKRLIQAGHQGWGCTQEDPSFPKREIAEEDGVCAAIGDLSEIQTDLKIGGRGLGLDLTRTYNSKAAQAGYKSTFGNGWTSPYSEHLTFTTELIEPETEEELGAPKSTKYVTLAQENGSMVEFAEGEGGSWHGPEGSPDVLTGSEGSGYTLTLENQNVYKFGGTTGRLESITDRYGNKTTFTYNGSGQLEKVIDPASRSLTFAYNGEGLIESVTDPLSHAVKYTYEGGNLKSVTQPGEAGLRWQFKYEGAGQLNEIIDGRSGKATIKYAGNHFVESKTDPMGRTTTFSYGSGSTTITNEATKAATKDYVTSNGQLAEVVHGFGTASATTESFKYDLAGDETSHTDGDGHTTKYEYDTHGNRTLTEDPEGHKTKWTYNSTHDVETETAPSGETTTYKREADGNPTTIERPAPKGETQTTTYKYNAYGLPESMTDPLKRTWKYEYDTAGDKTAETDPEGDKRTWGYEDSFETAMVSPRGHVKAGEESKYTTKTERDAQGRPIKTTDPLKHETTYKYDGDGNLELEVDPEKNETKYTYDADNERAKTQEPNGTITETGYDGAGKVTSQTDGSKHTTSYKRNVLEQVTEIIDPRERRTVQEYDKAGNLASVLDAAKRTTTRKYNANDRLSEITYSDEKTPTVKYEYTANGLRSKLTDGTGTTTYEYDQLDRLTETKDGHGDVAKYEYDVANEPTKITYPNGKAITREYDNVGRLKSVEDWAEHTTKFGYDADSNQTSTTFPSGTSNEDAYAYDATDAMSEVKMLKGGETLASLVYARNKDGEVTKATTKGLPGEEIPAFSYDANSRLSKGAGVTYKYDAANNPTTIGSTTYEYDKADQLEKATASKTTVATYGYDEIGDRTKYNPTGGPAVTYTYNQASVLTEIARPKEGSTPAIEDTYTYNGDGLRVSQAISGATTYLAWDLAEKLPLVLSDSAYSYLYGPDGLPFEQVTAEGIPTYLHHDQQGSVRVVTSATGVVVGTATYDGYGNRTGTLGSRLGYDGQYTDSDTGLVYLRARYYDPQTAQFLNMDPAVALTLTPYSYARDNPTAGSDNTGEYETNAAESRFAHEYSHQLALINHRLGKLSGREVELFEEVADYKFYYKLSRLATDPSLQARYEGAAHSYYARIAAMVYSDLSPLWKLNFGASPQAFVKVLLQVASKAFGV